jgi:hypothetical protein
LRKSKNSSIRCGLGGAVADGELESTCRAALNPSTGSTMRTPNAASISPALRADRNAWNPLNVCT